MIFPLYELKRVLNTRILSNCNALEEIFFENLKFFAIIFIRQRHYHDICGKHKTLPPGIEHPIPAKMPASPATRDAAIPMVPLILKYFLIHCN